MKRLEKMARLYGVLAVESRLRIIKLLRGGPLCVGALAARLDISQSAVSQHLRILRDAGLVAPERRGYFVHYRLNERALADCLKLTAELLGGSVEEQQACPVGKGGEQACAARRKAARSRRT